MSKVVAFLVLVGAVVTPLWAGYGVLVLGTAAALFTAACGSGDTDTTCAGSCVVVSQATQTLGEENRAPFAFQCPEDHPYLQNWDAEHDAHVSLLVAARSPNGMKVYARNAGSSPESFTVSLECNERAVASDAVKTGLLWVPEEALAAGGLS